MIINSKYLIILSSFLIFIILTVVFSFLFLETVFIENKDFIQTMSSIISAFGIIGVVLAIIQFYVNEKSRRTNLALEKMKLISSLMSDFYNNNELNELRECLRQQKKYSITNNLLRNDEVTTMNFFEAIGIAYLKEVLTMDEIDYMFGTVLNEIRIHPNLNRVLNEKKYSYEAASKLIFDHQKYRTLNGTKQILERPIC